MANLIIGGNTYKNIHKIQINQEDGTMATFVNRATYAQAPAAALVSFTPGTSGIRATVGMAVVESIPSPTITITIS